MGRFHAQRLQKSHCDKTRRDGRHWSCFSRGDFQHQLPLHFVGRPRGGGGFLRRARILESLERFGAEDFGGDVPKVARTSPSSSWTSRIQACHCATL
eukprot:symbB.v1.2.025908.t1/scaffold2550.1/size76503/2